MKDIRNTAATVSGTVAPTAAVRLLLLCALFSGAAALIYQVVWNRQLLTLFGSTTAATAAVIAVFMAGMALGAWLLSRQLHRLRMPLRCYAILELGAAAYAVLFPVLLPWVQPFYAGAWLAAADQPLLLNGLRLGLGFVLLLPSTLALGATLPLLVYLLRPMADGGGRSVARMYGFNAAGGAFGATLAGLVLIPKLGVMATYSIGIGLGVAAAWMALWLERLSGTAKTAAGSPPRAVLPVAPQPVTSPGIQGVNFLLPLALLLAGFAAMGYEVAWTRLLVLITGSSTYAFTLMLALYIVGLSTGSLWAGRFVDRLRTPALVFAHLQLGAALTAALGLWLFTAFPGMLLGWYRDWGISFNSHLAADAVFAALVILPPTFLLGAAFPVAVRMLDRGGERTAAETGRVYAWMTAGNVAGALAVGGGLISLLGLQGVLLLLAGLGATAGGVMVIATQGNLSMRKVTMAVALLGGMAIITWRPQWDPIVMTSGIYKEAPVYLGLGSNDIQLKNILSAYRLLYYKEGDQAVVSVVERPTLKPTPHRVLAIDGKVDASSGADMSTQILSGHLPLLLHAQARDVLVIGLASGVTAGAVAQHAQVENITVAEIEPAVAEAARAFDAFNHNVMDDPRLHLVLDDGRHYLGVTRKQFDVIISEPSNPWMSGPARLFTQEYFQQVHDHLAPGGVFAQWLQLYGLSTFLLKAELRTFLAAFPHTALVQVSQGDLLLLGSDRPLNPRETVLEPAVKDDLAGIGFTLPKLLARFISGEQGLAAWVGAGPVNSDDNGLLEFNAPRYLLVDTLENNRKAIAEADWKPNLKLWTNGLTPPAIIGMANAYLASGQIERAAFLATQLPDSNQTEQLLGDIAAQRGHWLTAREHWRSAATPEARLRLARVALEDRDIGMAEDALGGISIRARSANFYYLQALASLAKNNVAAADASLARISIGSDNGWQLLAPYLRAVLATRAHNQDHAARLRAAFYRQLDRLRRRLERESGQETMDALLAEVARLGSPFLTPTEHHDLQEAIRKRLTEPLPLYFRGVSLLWLGRPAEASATLRDYLSRLPQPDPDSYAYTLLRAPGTGRPAFEGIQPKRHAGSP